MREALLAERNEASECHTVGQQVPNVDFMEQSLAYDNNERENKRRFGRGLDRANDPGQAWVAVRVGTRERW